MGQCPGATSSAEHHSSPHFLLVFPGAVLIHEVKEKQAGALGSLCKQAWTPSGVMLSTHIRLLWWAALRGPLWGCRGRAVGQHCLGSSFLCPFLLQSARAGHCSMEDVGKLSHPQSCPGAPEPLTSPARSRWYGGSLGCLQTACWLLLLLCRAWWNSPNEAWVPRCCLCPTMSRVTHRFWSSSP